MSEAISTAHMNDLVAWLGESFDAYTKSGGLGKKEVSINRQRLLEEWTRRLHDNGCEKSLSQVKKRLQTELREARKRVDAERAGKVLAPPKLSYKLAFYKLMLSASIEDDARSESSTTTGTKRRQHSDDSDASEPQPKHAKVAPSTARRTSQRSQEKHNQTATTKHEPARRDELISLEMKLVKLRLANEAERHKLDMQIRQLKKQQLEAELKQLGKADAKADAPKAKAKTTSTTRRSSRRSRAL